MSERFLEGFVISPTKFAALVGTSALSAKTIRKKLGRSPTLSDVDMTLGEGDAKEGKRLVDEALDALAKGKPGPSDSPYRLTRVTTLVLHAYAEHLGTIELVPFVEGDDFGLWNPALRALTLPVMGKDYGRSSFAFPYARRTAKTAVGWPIMMLVDGSLSAWMRELATDWAKRLPDLSAKPFTDPKYGTEPERIAETKKELAESLATVRTWVGRAAKKKGQALVLILDGDQ